jgi:pimeloyl-ACP methyl ester carboxylesterase
MTKKLLLLACTLAVLVSCTLVGDQESYPGEIFAALPETVDPHGRYVFYIHGKIIEDQGLGAVSEEFGPYEVDQILKYIADAGYDVIGEIRSRPTDVDAYSTRVAAQMNALLDAGLKPENLTVVGFSKGAFITLLLSTKLANSRMNFVVMGICSDEVNADPGLRPTGRILSIYEESDEFGSSCKRLVDRSPGVADFTEIALNTGKRHGAFYTADPAWMSPMVSWFNGADD